MASYLVEAIGLLAGVLSCFTSCFSFIPQIIKLAREPDASAVSMRSCVITVIAFALWTTYGILSGSVVLIVANSVCFCLTAAILILKVWRTRGELRNAAGS